MFLLIDDNWLALSGWIAILERADFEVGRNNDAERAIKFFDENSHKINCVLLDIMMPAPAEWREHSAGGKRTGIVVADKLREVNPELPILFLTNQRDAAVIAQLRQYPRSRYIDKREVRPETFVKLVERLLAEINDDLADPPAQPATATE
jgi:DNA-binding NarL/FixJ family response regulator